MITTNTGAKKMESTDEWRQIVATSGGAHNDTVDAYDHCIGALQDSLGIVVDGNQSAVSANSGQFIILKNSSIVDSGDVMLADGLYTAAKSIPANTTIDKTYLTTVSGGGLNSLNSKIGNVGNTDLQTQVNALVTPPTKNVGSNSAFPYHDCNDCTDQNYVYDIEGGALNAPGTYYMMYVRTTSWGCFQFAVYYTGAIVKVRAKGNGTWSAWKEL